MIRITEATLRPKGFLSTILFRRTKYEIILEDTELEIKPKGFWGKFLLDLISYELILQCERD